MSENWSRRSLLRSGLVGLTFPSLLHAGAGTAKRFRVVETAGLRRFGFPVHTVIKGFSPSDGPFQLMKAGKPVPAQFSTVAGPNNTPSVVLDFNTGIGPDGTEEYEILSKADDMPETKRVPTQFVEFSSNSLKVKNGLECVLNENRKGFIGSVKSSKLNYISAPTFEQSLGSHGATEITLDSVSRFDVVRKGPFAVGIRRETPVELGRDNLSKSILDLTFPSSKSWIEFDWKLEDPDQLVSRMILNVKLDLVAGATLVDLGADSTVYTVLKPTEFCVFQANQKKSGKEMERDWKILRGEGDGEGQLFARGKQKPQGWAHVMDSTRATALGVDGFGDATYYSDEMTVRGDGSISIQRKFTPSTQTTRRLHCWFHFVPMPVQIGALTSPQAMMNPLKVEWLS